MLLRLFLVVISLTGILSAGTKWDSDPEIQLFREYLQIKSVQPDIDYEECLTYFKKQAANLGLPYKIFYPGGPKKPIFLMTWQGKQPNLPSIILNSHMDVVPVFEENWKHPPFAADIDADGKIFARGTQDMKSVTAQYLGALRALKKSGVTFKRTIHFLCVPDEETGSDEGMALFVKTQDFKNLNAGFALDEGMASVDNIYPIFFAERSIWHIYFTINGPPGHGSLLLENTVGEKLSILTTKMYAWRKYESERLKNNTDLTIGNVTSINLTEIKGGVQSNVIPQSIRVGFDVRIANDVNHDELLKRFEKWCEEAGGDIDITFTQKEASVPATRLDSSNPFWLGFKRAVDSLNMQIKPQVFPGGTDSRFLRVAGVPAIGFSPMIKTPVLLHDHNEFIECDTFLKGIVIYRSIIPAIANA